MVGVGGGGPAGAQRLQPNATGRGGVVQRIDAPDYASRTLARASITLRSINAKFCGFSPHPAFPGVASNSDGQ